MKICPACGRKNVFDAVYCDQCGLGLRAGPGARAWSAEGLESEQSVPGNGILSPGGQHEELAHRSGGFSQVFGLHPIVAMATLAVDAMLFTEEAATGGIGWVASIPIAATLAVATYLIQRRLYGDDRETAIGKALIVGLLTAIPTSLPGFLVIPSGVVGLVRSLRSRGEDSRVVRIPVR